MTDYLNTTSRQAILRLGAKEEGVLRNHMVMPNGRVRDSVVFSIIKNEWPGVKQNLEYSWGRADGGQDVGMSNRPRTPVQTEQHLRQKGGLETRTYAPIRHSGEGQNPEKPA